MMLALNINVCRKQIEIETVLHVFMLMLSRPNKRLLNRISVLMNIPNWVCLKTVETMKNPCFPSVAEENADGRRKTCE